MSVQPFDFRDIAALDDTAVALRTWISKSTSFFSDYWVEATGFSAKLEMGAVSTESYERVLSEVPRHDLCCVTEIKDKFSTIWYASGDAFRTVLGDLLCSGPAKPKEEGEESTEPSEVELSAIEIDLANYFVDRLAASFSHGWMGAGDLEINVTPLQKDARKLRLFRGKDLVTKIEVTIECKAGKASLNWLLPKAQLPDLLDETVDNRAGGNPKRPSPELIGQLPLEITTLLGNAKVSVTELSKLKPGELIVLDQRIDSPMVALVDGERSFECWPGRLGKQQAVQIARRLN